MKQHLTNPHTIALYLVALLLTGYQAAYQYLNPSNLEWQNAIIYGAMAIISAVVLGQHIVSVADTVDTLQSDVHALKGSGPPTQQVPAMPPKQ